MNAGLKKTSVLLGIMALVAAAGFFITWIVGQRNGSFAREGQEKSFRVVTSFYPMYIAAMNIIGDADGVELSNLTENQGGCLHDYQLTAADMKKLEGADVLIINGGGMETFLEQIQKAYPGLAIVNASAGLEKEGENPHYWMDPKKYKKQLAAMEAGLSSLDRAHKDGYEENRRVYEAQVDKVEKEMLSVIEGIPGEKAVLFHDAFYYLAQCLGIEIAYSIELEDDTSLNTGEIAEIVDQAKAGGVRLLFTEKQFSESIPLGISRETGADICVVDTLVSGAMEKDAYIKGMEKNIEEICRCLKALKEQA